MDSSTIERVEEIEEDKLMLKSWSLRQSMRVEKMMEKRRRMKKRQSHQRRRVMKKRREGLKIKIMHSSPTSVQGAPPEQHKLINKLKIKLVIAITKIRSPYFYVILTKKHV